MKKLMVNKSESGFSLVELMIVVGIIGVLATLALPRFKQFQAKAKMGEAKNILSHIYTLEQSYALDKNTFIAFATVVGRNADGTLTAASCTPAPNSGAQQIGFRIDPCVPGAANASPTPRYGYTVGNVTSSTFQAVATTGAALNNLVCPGNAAHAFTVNEQNQSVNEPVVGNVCAN